MQFKVQQVQLFSFIMMHNELAVSAVGFKALKVHFLFIIKSSIRPSIHHAGRLTQWPYLLQHIHRVPAALQSGREAGRRRGIVILCRLREKLGHRYLIRHPLNEEEEVVEEVEGVNKCPQEGLAMKAQRYKTM